MQRLFQDLGGFLAETWRHRTNWIVQAIWVPPLVILLVDTLLGTFWWGLACALVILLLNHTFVGALMTWCIGPKGLKGPPPTAPKLFSFPTWFIIRLRVRFGRTPLPKLIAGPHTLQEWNWGQTALCRVFDLVFWTSAICGSILSVRLLGWWLHA